MDATSADRLPIGVHSTRLPDWMVPLTPPSFDIDFNFRRLRPDLLIIEGLPYNEFLRLQRSSTFTTPATQTRLRQTCTLHIIEVGYTSEFSLDSSTAKKHKQHNQLVELLLFNNWKVASVPLNPAFPLLDTPLPPTLTPTPTPSQVYVFILGSSGFIFKPADTLLVQLGVSRSQIHTTLSSLASHAFKFHHSIICLRRRLENSSQHFRQPVLLPDPP
jgi:hypothetical protein